MSSLKFTFAFSVFCFIAVGEVNTNYHQSSINEGSESVVNPFENVPIKPGHEGLRYLMEAPWLTMIQRGPEKYRIGFPDSVYQEMVDDKRLNDLAETLTNAGKSLETRLEKTDEEETAKKISHYENALNNFRSRLMQILALPPQEVYVFYYAHPIGSILIHSATQSDENAVAYATQNEGKDFYVWKVGNDNCLAPHRNLDFSDVPHSTFSFQKNRFH